MSLTIVARQNTLDGRTEDWRFHASHSGIVEYDELIDMMAAARTTLSKPDILAVVTLFTETVSSLVAEGKFVKMPLGDYYLSASGTVADADRKFTPRVSGSGHGLRLRFRPNRAVEKAIAAAVIIVRDKDTERRSPQPLILEAVDGIVTERRAPGEAIAVTPGGYANLRGHRLNFDKADGRLGLFLEPSGGGDAMRCPIYASVKPSLVIFQLPPSLPAGDYSLVVRTATKAGTMRQGRLKETVRAG